MALIVADTDVLIDFLRGKGAGADRVAFELARGDLATTAVTVFELLAGAHGKRSVQAVDALLAGLAILPLETEAARAAAEVRRDLESSGLGIGMGDSLIAGICLRNRKILLTRNRKHFERVKGLSLGTITVKEL